MEKIIKTAQWLSILLLQCLLILPLQANPEEQFRNRVNLALRQTGHQLLQEQNDSTSQIAAVEYRGNDAFLLPLAGSFNYDTLPLILAQAFADYGITEPYELVVKDCEQDIPILGFNKAAVERNDIPCRSRQSVVDCGNIWVQFQSKAEGVHQQNSGLAWLLLPVFAGLGLFYYRRLGQDSPGDSTNSTLTLGQFLYDPAKQILHLGQEQTSLTFRENKLLHFLVNHSDEVLNRADILAAVWEEEGVIVGRSLDVFISRLRKILKQDPTVQIKTVHGVGYRLELP